MRRLRPLKVTPALQGAALLAFCGVLAMAKSTLGLELATVAAVTLVAIGLTIALPWKRVPTVAGIFFVLLAAALIDVAEVHSLVPIRAYGNLYVLLFAWVGATQRPGLSVWLATPLGSLYAVPLIVSNNTPPLDPRALIVTLAVGVLIAETMARMLRAVRMHQRRAERSADLFRTVSAAGANVRALEPADVLDAIVDAVVEIGYDGANIAIVDHKNNTFTPLHARGISRAFEGKVFALTSGSTARAVETRLPVVTNDYAETADGIHAIAATGVRTTVAVPMFRHGVVVAVLHAASLDRVDIHEEDVDALAMLATTAGNGLDLAFRFGSERAAAKLHATEAATDHLTGLGNRRHAERLMDRLQPDDVVALLDLDHFKDVNDRLGHAAGDAVLVALAEHFVGHLRDSDTVSRYGGEEFLLVLSGTTLAAAMQVIQRLQQSWRDTNPLTTFSVGAAEHGGRGPLATLGAADRALYEAKRRGRDRCCSELDVAQAPVAGLAPEPSTPDPVVPESLLHEKDKPGNTHLAKRR